MEAITVNEKVRAEREIRRMRSSLAAWLKYRKRNDDVALGKVKGRLPAHVVAKMLPHRRDWVLEQNLALELHALLSEVLDAAALPNPDISKDPNAAVKLAKIAIAGKLPEEASGPQAQGLIWLWPAVIVVGLVLVTIMTKIRSDADVAKEKERVECIKMGACTDYGFWLKLGAIVVAGWVVWDKFGLREAVQKRKARRLKA